MAGAKLEPFYNIVKHPNYPDGYAVVSCVSQEIFDSAVSFKPDSGDHFIVSYPKCGTTWMMNIMYLMKNGGAPLAKGDSMDNHIPFLEFVGGEVPAALTRPRTIKSHFYYDLIPKNSEAKYVFVARNPKDCLVSFYHHTVGFNEYYKYKEGTFDNFFEIFIEGRCDSGDYFKLVPEWYQQSLLHDNIHFVLYEDLKNDIQKEILRLADFLGPAWRPLLEDNDGKLLKDVIVNSGFKKMQEDSKIFCVEERPDDLPFVRKGVVGDWRETLSRGQSEQINVKLAEAGAKHPGFDKLWNSYSDLLE